MKDFSMTSSEAQCPPRTMNLDLEIGEDEWATRLHCTSPSRRYVRGITRETRHIQVLVRDFSIVSLVGTGQDLGFIQLILELLYHHYDYRHVIQTVMSVWKQTYETLM